jgi:hypothetical protein
MPAVEEAQTHALDLAAVGIGTIIFTGCIFLIYRYGSDLELVESFAENNYTAGLVTRSIGPADRNGQHYWLGLASLDDLRTNTLESAAGLLVSQYAGIYRCFEEQSKEHYTLSCTDFSVTSKTSITVQCLFVVSMTTKINCLF